MGGLEQRFLQLQGVLVIATDAAVRGWQRLMVMLASFVTISCVDPGATLDDLRESVETLVKAEQTARRLLGSAHPEVAMVEGDLRKARTALSARQAGMRVVLVNSRERHRRDE